MGDVVPAGITIPGRISSFGEDGDGEIWMSSMMTNAIFKLVSADAAPAGN
jgi:hypothetical protein